MKVKTRWEKSNSVILKMRCFNDEIGFFKVDKIQQCYEYCKSAENLNGTHWFEKKRVFITSDNGLKYIVPYIWIVFHSTNKDGKLLWKIIDNVN